MRVGCRPHKKLLDRIGSPQNSFLAVHVTGSKGKGSVSTLISEGLQRSGCRVGLYGSPHVERVNERIKICGNEIADDTLADVLNIVLDVQSRHVPDATWFDVVSAAGMLAFKNQNIDWAVVEVGMGGRHDSTNVLNAPVAVVTNIALEHKEIIGPTVRDIAHEKAGIIGSNSQTVVGMDENDPVAPIFIQESRIVNASPPLFLPQLPGVSFASHNLELARRALQLALPDIDAKSTLTDKIAAEALARLPGRMERFAISRNSILASDRLSAYSAATSPKVDVILDGAHTANSVSMVLTELATSDRRSPVMLLACGSEKDAYGICQAMLQACPVHTIITMVGFEQVYMQATELKKVAERAGLKAITACSDPHEALACALHKAVTFNTYLVILGSLHLAGKLRPRLRAAARGP